MWLDDKIISFDDKLFLLLSFKDILKIFFSLSYKPYSRYLQTVYCQSLEITQNYSDSKPNISSNEAEKFAN